ncbi:hypothetical protein V1289_008711 [Bradyrhizobium sp. AZCC 2289]
MKHRVCGGADRRQALERCVAALKGSGFDIGWIDGDMGQGPTLRRLSRPLTKLQRRMTARWKIATKCSLFHMEQSQEE